MEQYILTWAYGRHTGWMTFNNKDGAYQAIEARLDEGADLDCFYVFRGVELKLTPIEVVKSFAIVEN